MIFICAFPFLKTDYSCIFQYNQIKNSGLFRYLSYCSYTFLLSLFFLLLFYASTRLDFANGSTSVTQIYIICHLSIIVEVVLLIFFQYIASQFQNSVVFHLSSLYLGTCFVTTQNLNFIEFHPKFNIRKCLILSLRSQSSQSGVSATRITSSMNLSSFKYLPLNTTVLNTQFW